MMRKGNIADYVSYSGESSWNEYTDNLLSNYSDYILDRADKINSALGNPLGVTDSGNIFGDIEKIVRPGLRKDLLLTGQIGFLTELPVLDKSKKYDYARKQRDLYLEGGLFFDETGDYESKAEAFVRASEFTGKTEMTLTDSTGKIITASNKGSLATNVIDQKIRQAFAAGEIALEDAPGWLQNEVAQGTFKSSGAIREAISGALMNAYRKGSVSRRTIDAIVENGAIARSITRL